MATASAAAPRTPSARDAPRRPGTGQRILVTRLRYPGDVLLSLPLVAALRRALPAAELHYLAEAAAHAVLEAQPEIDVRWIAPRGTVPGLRLARALHGEHFTAAVDLFCNPRSALLVRATAAPVRIGEDRRGRRHAYTLARQLVPGRSALEQHLGALAGLGLEVPPPQRPVLHLRAAERDAGRVRWGKAAPGILLHVAATQPAKEWPVEHAAAFVRRVRRAGLRVVVTTAPLRPEPTQALAAALAGDAIEILPVLPLRELFAVLAHALGVVSVDGAIAHAAVALGRPTVALFGPTDPDIWFPYAHFGPYRVLHAGVDCSRCDRQLCPTHHCMAALAPDRAWETLLPLLATEDV